MSWKFASVFRHLQDSLESFTTGAAYLKMRFLFEMGIATMQKEIMSEKKLAPTDFVVIFPPTLEGWKAPFRLGKAIVVP